jgi:hypothetical protein
MTMAPDKTVDAILKENKRLSEEYVMMKAELAACNHAMLKYLVRIDELEAEVERLQHNDYVL